MPKISSELEKCINILKMREEDSESIQELEKICFSNPWSKDSILEGIKNTNAYFIVAKFKKITVGYAGMYFAGGQGYVYNLAVYPKFRNLGIGKKLISSLVQYSILKNLEFISLEVRESNKAAYSIYLKSGFEYIGKRKNFYKYPTEDAIIMTKYLKY